MIAPLPPSWRISARRGQTPQLDAPADRPWFSIRNAAEPVAELTIFDDVGGWGTTADDFARQLKDVTAPELVLLLNSPGGEVFAGMAIADAIRRHPAKVTAYVTSLAASIASVIAMAGDRVVMAPGSMLMIHDAQGICQGDAGDMAEQGALLDRVSNTIAAVYAERAGGEAKAWRKRMKAETWFTAEEAVAVGLADEVATYASEAKAEPERPTMVRNMADDLDVDAVIAAMRQGFAMADAAEHRGRMAGLAVDQDHATMLRNAIADATVPNWGIDPTTGERL